MTTVTTFHTCLKEKERLNFNCAVTYSGGNLLLCSGGCGLGFGLFGFFSIQFSLSSSAAEKQPFAYFKNILKMESLPAQGDQ